MRCVTSAAMLAALALNSSVSLAEGPEDGIEGGCMRLDRMVYHAQGWGVLGVNTAAHARDIEAAPLRIGGVIYEVGLGDHAPSESIFLLRGACVRFSADVGVQQQAYNDGSVVFQAHVDGEKVFDSGVMTQDSPPQHVSVDLRGKEELRLVTTDAGDGLTCDMANWVNFELVEDPEAKAGARAFQNGVNVAPFATLRSWDPARMEGTQATRLETMPAEDLFPGQTLLPDKDGLYSLPAYEGGGSTVGLEWLERRRLTQVALAFEGIPLQKAAIRLEYWKMAATGGSPGGSRWQGSWQPVEAEHDWDGPTLHSRLAWGGTPGSHGGALKLRWVVPAEAMPTRVHPPQAHTLTQWREAEVTLEAETEGEARVTVYNGAIQGGPSLYERTWDLRQPLTLAVRYARTRLWEITDRTVLRVELPAGMVAVALDDIVERGPVYVPHAGLIARTGGQPPLEVYRKAIADKTTLLDRVRDMPDQTVARAERYTHRPEGDLGPTMISLACDNHKFIVERSGVIQFDDRPEVYNLYESMYAKPYAVQVIPSAGDGEPASTRRWLQSERMPILLIEKDAGGARYTQRTFVAPYGDWPGAGDIPWYLGYRALGVSEFTIANGAETGPVALTVRFVADVESETPAEVQVAGGALRVTKDGKLLAHARLDGLGPLNAEVREGELRIGGDLEPWERAALTLHLPRWEGACAEDLADAPEADQLAARTEAYWRRVLGEGMGVDLPNDLLDNVVPASFMHCLLAARNEDRVRIAPWIGAYHYGPLESEANSIIMGMQSAGFEDFARRSLEYYIARYNEKGFLTTGYTVMGTGWHLWALGEYYKLTRNRAWLGDHADEVARLCRWIMSEREKTMRKDAAGERVPEWGLMPPGVGADWEVYAYYFYLNGTYYAGLRSAAEALADIGYDGADDMLKAAEDFQACIVRAFEWVRDRAPVAPLQDGTWVPYYPTHVYAPAPIEHFYMGEDFGRSWCYDVELGAPHLVPQGVLSPESPASDWMVNHLEDVQFLRDGWFYYPSEDNEADWFNLGGFAKVQPYYARTVEHYAARDDVKPFVRSYVNSTLSLLNREDLSLWEHFVNGAYNKTHETGYFINQSRLMLVQERGEALWLAPFVSANWLRDGLRVAASHVPTYFGETSFAIDSHAAEGCMEARIEVPQRQPPETVVIRLRHPEGVPIARADVEGAKLLRIGADGATVHLKPQGDRIQLRAEFE